jgi:hypothetical protein
MEWAAMDATATDFDSGVFDCIIEKSLIDAVLTDVIKGASLTRELVIEMHRVLKTGGVYIIISLHKWDDIRSYFCCTESIKLACAHDSVQMSGTTSRTDAACFAVCKKMPTTATAGAIAVESASLAALLA